MSSGIRLIDVREQNTLSIRETATMDNIRDRLGAIYGEIFQYMALSGIQPAGPPFAMYHRFDMKNMDLEAGFPVREPIAGEGRIKAGKIPGGKVITATHMGPYTTLEDTYNRIVRWIEEHGYSMTGAMWESYLTDPNEVKDPAKWKTEIFLPIG